MTHKILAIGEVLWDLLPTGKQLGGAPANFTYHCRSLGADAGLVTRIGEDGLGRAVLDRFRLLGLPIETVQVDPELPTGTVDVALDPDGQPRFTVREHVAWDRIAADEAALAAAAEADALGFGSLAQRSEPSRRAVRALVSASRPGALRLFDVNLRPPFVDRDVIAESLTLANALKLNDHELPELAAMFGLPGDARTVMAGLADRFGLSLVALTRGAGGGLLLADGLWSDHPGQPVVVRDTIGAGDAFTAALVVGRLSGRPLDVINRHANAVAAFVCSQPGGTPTLPDDLKEPEG
ncbi:MAG: sugar kinase, ribokinase [Planctomycetota bacterium]|nr:sugar kinase, ribokinase [Planctomycetota bacterium]